MQKRKNLETGIPLATVLAKHRPGVSVSMILTWAWSATIIVILLMTPTILQKNFGIMVSVAQTGNLFATIGLVIGAAIYGWLAGRFGVARVIAFGCAIQSVCYLVLLQVAANGSAFIVPIYALTGLSLGAIGTYPLAWIRSLPARVRFSGISFSYNVAYAIFGSITPVLIGFAVSWNRLEPYDTCLVCRGDGRRCNRNNAGHASQGSKFCDIRSKYLNRYPGFVADGGNEDGWFDSDFAGLFDGRSFRCA
ncbi:MAG: hypothetical protein WBB98_11280 [Xanthobacteraceae bacterium]